MVRGDDCFAHYSGRYSPDGFDADIYPNLGVGSCERSVGFGGSVGRTLAYGNM